MPGPSTAITLNDLLNTEIINDLTLDAARVATFLPQLVWQKDIEGMGSYTVTFPRYASVSAAALTDGTDMGASVLSTDQSASITAAEVGIMITLTDKALKGSGGRIDINAVARQGGLAVADKLEGDIAATFANFTASVGTSGEDLNLAVIDDAIYQVKLANAPIGNPGNAAIPPALAGLQCVLHSVQARDLRVALRTANFAFVGPAEMGVLLDAGRVPSGLMGSYMGVTFWESSKPPTANTGADRVGALFVPAAIGLVTCGGVNTEFQRDASLRATEANIVLTYGVGIAASDYGVKIVTDA